MQPVLRESAIPRAPSGTVRSPEEFLFLRGQVTLASQPSSLGERARLERRGQGAEDLLPFEQEGPEPSRDDGLHYPADAVRHK